jgi:hypothetical protein
MAVAIHFDDQLHRRAIEVERVRPERMLFPKLQPIRSLP